MLLSRRSPILKRLHFIVTARHPEFLIVQAIYTHLGCAVVQVSVEDAAGHAASEGWPDGFFSCPCHDAKFDLAGRVYKGMPAPTNLVMPNHKFVTPAEVMFGHPTDKF